MEKKLENKLISLLADIVDDQRCSVDDRKLQDRRQWVADP